MRKKFARSTYSRPGVIWVRPPVRPTVRPPFGYGGSNLPPCGSLSPSTYIRRVVIFPHPSTDFFILKRFLFSFGIFEVADDSLPLDILLLHAKRDLLRVQRYVDHHTCLLACGAINLRASCTVYARVWLPRYSPRSWSTAWAALMLA